MKFKSPLLLLCFLFLITIGLPGQAQKVKRADYSIENNRSDSLIDQTMAENHIPGLAIAVVKNGEIIYTKGYGLSNLELRTSVQPSNVFAIYSITKTFTAVSIMMLSEGGKLSIDDAIGKYLAELPETWKMITIQHLLTHTSGLPELCESPANICFTSKDFTAQEVLESVLNMPVKFAPGEKWEYSNTGFYLLGLIIEKVSGKTYGEFLEERIFKPLGMTQSKLQNYKEVIPHRVNGYTWKNNNYYNALQVSPTLSFSLAGITSTVLDLAKYDSALYTEKLLHRSTMNQMFSKVHLINGKEIDHGLGFGMTPFQGHRRVGHSGGHTGFTSTLTRLIDDKITVIILSNSDDNGYKVDNGFLLSDIANLIASFYWK